MYYNMKPFFVSKVNYQTGEMDIFQDGEVVTVLFKWDILKDHYFKVGDAVVGAKAKALGPNSDIIVHVDNVHVYKGGVVS